MAFPVYNPQNLSLPPIRQLPEDVRNPLASLGSIIGEIAAAQRARRMDELNLKKAQMSLADVERQRADEAAMRNLMQAEFAPQAITGETPATELTDEAYDAEQLAGTVRKLRGLGSPAALEMASKLEEKSLFGGQKIANTKLNARINFLKAVAGKAGEIKKAFGGNVEAMEALDIPPAAARAISQLPDEAVVDPYEVNIGGVPFIRYTVKGEPRLIHKWTGEIRTNMLAMDPTIAPAVAADQQREIEVARARAQASGEQARITKQTLGPSDLPTINDMDRRIGVSPVGEPIYKGLDGRKYVDRGGSIGLTLYTDGTTNVPATSEPAPQPGVSPIPSRLGQPAPASPDARSTDGAMPVEPMMTPSEKKAAVEAAKEARRQEEADARIVRSDGQSLAKSKTFELYRNAQQPKNSILRSKAAIAQIAAKGPEGMTGADMETLRQADNELVRVAATLFESKTGVVREGEVKSLLGDTTLARDVIKTLEWFTTDKTAEMRSQMGPEMRQAIIRAAEDEISRRTDNMRTALHNTRRDAWSAVAADAGDLMALEGWAPPGGVASTPQPIASSTSPLDDLL